MKAKRLLISLAVVILSVFVILYAMIQLISGLTADVTYEYVTVQKQEKTLEKTGYLLRNESVLYASSEGILTYSVSESQKVGVGQLIATVYPSAQGINVQEEINEIEKKIAILTKSAVDTSYLTSDVSKIDGKIYSSLINANTALGSKDLSLIPKEKEQLLINMNKRLLVTAGQGDYAEQIAQLQEKKDQLTASLQNPISTVYADKTGYFSTLLDGFETVYTPDKIENLTLEGYDALVQSSEVEYTNSAIGKLVTDFDWYTLCEATVQEVEDLTVGKAYPITYLYSSAQQLSGILAKKIIQTDSDRAILVFLIEEVPKNFDYTRQQTIKIVLSSKNGIAFPASALRIVDGVQGVYVVAGNVVDLKKVEIIDSADSKYLSKEFSDLEEGASEYLSRFDRVITEGKNLYVGQILD